MAMNRLLRILFLALLLGPQFVQMTLPVIDRCEESRDCCARGACDAACPQCPCCIERALGTAVSLAPMLRLAPPAEEAPQPIHCCQSPGPTEILHVPKPTLA